MYSGVRGRWLPGWAYSAVHVRSTPTYYVRHVHQSEVPVPVSVILLSTTLGHRGARATYMYMYHPTTTLSRRSSPLIPAHFTPRLTSGTSVPDARRSRPRDDRGPAPPAPPAGLAPCRVRTRAALRGNRNGTRRIRSRTNSRTIVTLGHPPNQPESSS